MQIYCDANAGAATAPEVLDWLGSIDRPFHNPSSSHFQGQQARHQIESAREQIAALLKVEPSRIVFTSGGSESVSTAIWSLSSSLPSAKVLIGSIDHPISRGFSKMLADLGTHSIEFIDTSATKGRPNLQAIHELSKAGEPVVLHLQSAHSELGTLLTPSDLDTIRSILPEGSRIHIDACQSIGKHSFEDLITTSDSFSLSAHKIGGLAGTGLLCLPSDLSSARALLPGTQEWKRRAGTENAVGIQAFAIAARARVPLLDSQKARWEEQKTVIADTLRKQCNAEIISCEDGLPQTLFFRVPGFNSHKTIMQLDQMGVAVSPGTACRSGLVAPNETALALGYEEKAAAECIRISLDWGFKSEEEAYLIEALEQVFSRTRS